MKVKEIVNRDFVYATVPGTRDEVLELMRKRNVNVVPVVKKGTMTLAGIVTHKELMEKPHETQIALLMRRDPEVVSADADVVSLVKLMLEKNLSHVPVVDSDGSLVGVVSVSDVVRKAVAVEKRSEPIKPFVQRVIIAAWEKTPLPVAYTIMRLAKAPVLHVLDDKGKLVGVVDESDFLKASEVVSEEKVSSIISTSEGTDWSWDASSIFYITTKKLNLPNIPLSEIMTRDIVMVNEHTSLTECALKMLKHDLNQLPVKDATGNIVGVINETDILRGYYEAALKSGRKHATSSS